MMPHQSEMDFQAIMDRKGIHLDYVGGGSGHHFRIDNELDRWYTPDFFNPKTGEYYEVKSTREQFISARIVFRDFRAMHPHIVLHVVCPDGTPCESVWPLINLKNGKPFGQEW